jgi:hypothetical protein
MSQAPKLAGRVIDNGRCLLKQRYATRKKRMLGRIPHRAPFVYLVISS